MELTLLLTVAPQALEMPCCLQHHKSSCYSYLFDPSSGWRLLLVFFFDASSVYAIAKRLASVALAATLAVFPPFRDRGLFCRQCHNGAVPLRLDSRCLSTVAAMSNRFGVYARSAGHLLLFVISITEKEFLFHCG